MKALLIAIDSLNFGNATNHQQCDFAVDAIPDTQDLKEEVIKNEENSDQTSCTLDDGKREDYLSCSNTDSNSECLKLEIIEQNVDEKMSELGSVLKNFVKKGNLNRQCYHNDFVTNSSEEPERNPEFDCNRNIKSEVENSDEQLIRKEIGDDGNNSGLFQEPKDDLSTEESTSVQGACSLTTFEKTKRQAPLMFPMMHRIIQNLSDVNKQLLRESISTFLEMKEHCPPDDVEMMVALTNMEDAALTFDWGLKSS